MLGCPSFIESMVEKKDLLRDRVFLLMTQPEIPNALYFHITLLADKEGKPQWGIQTHWCGYTKTKPKREIREGALYHGEAQRQWLFEHGEPALLINSEEDANIWLTFGGHGLVLESIGKKKFTRVVAPREAARDSGGFGFRDLSDATEQQLQHAPSKKLRMEVLTRDGRRCVICGRSPAYYVDLELHVHHAIPWGEGGLTETENLITLCKTCHDGLDPHADFDLIMRLRDRYPKPKAKYLGNR